MSTSPTNTLRPSKLPKIYSRLLRRFGPQGWWPTTPPDSPAPVYSSKNARGPLTEDQRLEICLGALLTQNTNWNNVVKVLTLLKQRDALNFRSLRHMDFRTMSRLFRSSGYFRQKARRVQGFLAEVEKETGGHVGRFLEGPLPEVRDKLLRIKGIGPETADSMLLYAGGRPVFVVDAYTRRVGERWGLLKGGESYSEIQSLFMKNLQASTTVFNEYHALIVELAKNFCKKVPECRECHLLNNCLTGKLSRKKK